MDDISWKSSPLNPSNKPPNCNHQQPPTSESSAQMSSNGREYENRSEQKKCIGDEIYPTTQNGKQSTLYYDRVPTQEGTSTLSRPTKYSRWDVRSDEHQSTQSHTKHGDSRGTRDHQNSRGRGFRAPYSGNNRNQDRHQNFPSQARFDNLSRHDPSRVKNEPRSSHPQPSIDNEQSTWDIPAPPRNTPTDRVIPKPPSLTVSSDDIVLLKKVRKRSQKTVVEIDDSGERSRRIKMEKIDGVVKREPAEIIPSLSVSTGPNQKTSVPKGVLITTLETPNKSQCSAPTPSTQPPSAPPMQFPTTATTSTPELPDTTNSEIPLVGLPLKLEPGHVQYDSSVNAENFRQCDKLEYEITVVCTVCHLKMIHTCAHPPQEERLTVKPGELYVCDCNFLFLHASNCGGNQKASFAPDSKQQGRMRIVDRIQEYTCHHCKFKFSFGELKKVPKFFTKLTKTDILSSGNKCPLMTKCDQISGHMYDRERTLLQNVSGNSIIRSLEEYVGIRRTFIDKCYDGCCKMFHECISDADEAQKPNEAVGH